MVVQMFELEAHACCLSVAYLEYTTLQIWVESIIPHRHFNLWHTIHLVFKCCPPAC